jgi:tRNA-5-methyluridine54 2-sulfurtransferase
MHCLKCDKKPVITLQHGDLCKLHFISYFEEKVFKTINKFRMIDRKDNLCVAASGGKDSLTVLYLTHKYLEKYQMKNPLQALVIDEGIRNYRGKTIIDLQQFCDKYEIKLTQASFEKELGRQLDDAYPIINKDSNKKPCNVCGVWRRYLLNKYARTLGTTKVVTGHNLDDEAQAIMMNMFKANTKLAGRLGPISGVKEDDLFIQRVKPLYFCSDKEVRLYTLLKGFKVQFTECPYASEGYRYQIQEMLNDFEYKYKGTKQGIVNSFLALLPLMNESEKNLQIGKCQSCNEASNKDICNACEMKEVINA